MSVSLEIFARSPARMKRVSLSAPWPDPNSPILSRIDFGVPLPELLLWLHVRDMLLGENFVDQDISSALSLARNCKHPDAVWLSSVCKDASSIDEARDVFLSHQDDARALCFAWFLSSMKDDDLSLLRRSAQLGHAFACATLIDRVWSEDSNLSYSLAERAAGQLERDGLYWLGMMKGWREDNLLIAAELGHGAASSIMVDFVGRSDPAHWVWLARAASRGFSGMFLTRFALPVRDFFKDGTGSATEVFFIGRTFERGNFAGGDEIEKALAIDFYRRQVESSRKAVDTWVLIGKRLGIIKDIRNLIANLIWDARFEANYKVFGPE